MNTLEKLDMAELLDSEEVMAGYLSEIMETGDPELILSAIGDIARAKGMASLARDSGLNRESLYKAFRSGTRPQFATVLKILSALRLNLHVRPA